TSARATSKASQRRRAERWTASESAPSVTNNQPGMHLATHINTAVVSSRARCPHGVRLLHREFDAGVALVDIGEILDLAVLVRPGREVGDIDWNFQPGLLGRVTLLQLGLDML